MTYKRLIVAATLLIATAAVVGLIVLREVAAPPPAVEKVSASTVNNVDFTGTSPESARELRLAFERLEQGDFAAAKSRFNRLLSAPLTPWAQVGLAYSHLGAGELEAAEQSALSALASNPFVANAYDVLSHVEFERDHFDQSLYLLETALACSPPENLRHNLETFRGEILRHTRSEAELNIMHSAHLRLKYDNRTVSTALAENFLRSAEQSLTNIRETLGLAGRKPITIVLHDAPRFVEQTHGPAWSSGLYDGKIRLPIEASSWSGLDRFEEVPLAKKTFQTLTHELTHAILAESLPQALPLWFDEGLAQHIAGDVLRWQSSGVPIDLGMLDRSFTQRSAVDAERAYGESYQLIAALLQRGGWAKIQALLAQMQRGQSMSQALAGVYHLQPRDLAVLANR